MRRIKRIGSVLIILAITFLGFYFYLVANYYPPILMYHHIDENIAQKNTIAVSLDIFAKQIAFIKRHNYKVVSLEKLCRMVRAQDKLPHNLLVITFDDGYKNNLAAVKILKEYNLPATIFMVINWIDKQGYLTKQDLDWTVKNSSISLGSHTLNHHYLPELSIEGIKEEGYLCACTTNRGFMRKLDIYALRRIKITNRDLGIRLWGKLTGFYNVFRRLKPPY